MMEEGIFQTSSPKAIIVSKVSSSSSSSTSSTPERSQPKSTSTKQSKRLDKNDDDESMSSTSTSDYSTPIPSMEQVNHQQHIPKTTKKGVLLTLGVTPTTTDHHIRSSQHKSTTSSLQEQLSIPPTLPTVTGRRKKGSNTCTTSSSLMTTTTTTTNSDISMMPSSSSSPSFLLLLPSSTEEQTKTTEDQIQEESTITIITTTSSSNSVDSSETSSTFTRSRFHANHHHLRHHHHNHLEDVDEEESSEVSCDDGIFSAADISSSSSSSSASESSSSASSTVNETVDPVVTSTLSDESKSITTTINATSDAKEELDEDDFDFGLRVTEEEEEDEDRNCASYADYDLDDDYLTTNNLVNSYWSGLFNHFIRRGSNGNIQQVIINGRSMDVSSPRYSVLSFDQVVRLDIVMDSLMQIHGRGNFPTLEVRLKDLVSVVKNKLNSDGVFVRDIRLNGGAASHVLSADDSHHDYTDLDLIFAVDLNNHRTFDKVRSAVLDSLVEFLPEGVNRKKMTSCTLKEAYVHKMVKVTEGGDRWSLISLSNNEGRDIEIKFVDTMKRQFEFSVDSFQIILDSLLSYYECTDGSCESATTNSSSNNMSENMYPTVVGESVYGDFLQAMNHLSRKVIATRSPEEIRGGGLLKYCRLQVLGYKPVRYDEIKNLEKYMCSRFFIDFSDINVQRVKLANYLNTHFKDDDGIKYRYLNILEKVVDESTVCLMGHERRQTLALIEEFAYHYYYQQATSLHATPCPSPCPSSSNNGQSVIDDGQSVASSENFYLPHPNHSYYNPYQVKPKSQTNQNQGKKNKNNFSKSNPNHHHQQQNHPSQPKKGPKHATNKSYQDRNIISSQTDRDAIDSSSMDLVLYQPTTCQQVISSPSCPSCPHHGLHHHHPTLLHPHHPHPIFHHHHPTPTPTPTGGTTVTIVGGTTGPQIYYTPTTSTTFPNGGSTNSTTDSSYGQFMTPNHHLHHHGHPVQCFNCGGVWMPV